MMGRYLISFNDGTMIIPEEELPAVSEDSPNVVHEAKVADAWIFGGGILSQRANIVATAGKVSDVPYPEPKAVLGCFLIIEVPSHGEALAWTGKIAIACR